MMNKIIIALLFSHLILHSCGQDDKLYINNTIVDVNDKTSNFYYDSIKHRLKQSDSTLTPIEILSYTWYVQQNDLFNPSVIDKEAEKLYQLNEAQKYTKAIRLANDILSASPNNITAFKELAYAYSKLNKKDSSELYFTLMVKSIKAAKLYGNGSYDSPYLLNNSFELVSIFEAQYGLYPENSGVLKDSKGQIRTFKKTGDIGKFCLLNHWEKYLKSGQFVEGDLSMEDILDSEKK